MVIPGMMANPCSKTESIAVCAHAGALLVENPSQGPMSVFVSSSNFVNNSLLLPAATHHNVTSEGQQQKQGIPPLYYSANAVLVRLAGSSGDPAAKDTIGQGSVVVIFYGCSFSNNVLNVSAVTEVANRQVGMSRKKMRC